MLTKYIEYERRLAPASGPVVKPRQQQLNERNEKITSNSVFCTTILAVNLLRGMTLVYVSINFV